MFSLFSASFPSFLKVASHNLFWLQRTYKIAHNIELFLQQLNEHVSYLSVKTTLSIASTA